MELCWPWGRLSPQKRDAAAGFQHWTVSLWSFFHASPWEGGGGVLLKSSCGSAEQLHSQLCRTREEPGLGLGLEGDVGFGPNCLSS